MNHEHRLTLIVNDRTYAELTRRAEARKRSVSVEATSLLESLTAAPATCRVPTAECPIRWVGFEQGKPISAICGACGHGFDVRDGLPLGNSARF